MTTKNENFKKPKEKHAEQAENLINAGINEAYSGRKEDLRGNEAFIDYQYELQVEREKNEAIMDMARRLQADFDNYRKRNLETGRIARDEGIADTVKQFLPVYDALMQSKTVITDEKVLEGINMIERAYLSVLKEMGIEPITALNKPFNPDFHNAIYAEEKHKTAPGIVLEELQKGFVRGEKVIRYSLVKISK